MFRSSFPGFEGFAAMAARRKEKVRVDEVFVRVYMFTSSVPRSPDKIPGIIKTRSFISQLGNLLRLPKEKIKELKNEYRQLLDRRFYELKKLEKAKLLFRAVHLKNNTNVYIFHDFLKEIYDSKRLQLVGEIYGLRSGGVLIVDMIKGPGINTPTVDYNTSITYEDGEYNQSIPKNYE